MALFQTRLRSKQLEMSTGVSILVPTDTAPVPDGGYPVLYLLHGISDDCTTWLRNTRIECYAEKYGVAVVMPEAQQSFYSDMVCGLKYGGYISEELPRFCQTTFPVSAARENNYIAGLSMGGYGALKTALTKSGSYAGCAALSALMSPCAFGKFLAPDDTVRKAIENCFGTDLKSAGTDNDIPSLIAKYAENPEKSELKLYIACGKSDAFYNQAQTIHSLFVKYSIAHKYESAHGGHDWDFWDEYINRALAYFLR